MADQRIKINTNLPGFVLLDALTEVSAGRICGVRRFADDFAFLGAEGLAQLGAMHARFLTGFEKHVFLAKIKSCLMPGQATLTGEYRLKGSLLSQGNKAFSYELTATRGKKLEIKGIFLYAAVDYDDSLQRARLQEHYRGIFTCLKNAARRDSPKGEMRVS